MPALRRTVMVMDLVSSSAEPLTAADITRALKLPKSTAHGLFAVMQELNLW
ncbi:helix-turn-helix domain-containing protein [Pannonibacter sp. Pt2-lr]